MTTDPVLTSVADEHIRNRSIGRELQERIEAAASTPREKAIWAETGQARKHVGSFIGQVEQLKQGGDPAAVNALIQNQLKPAAKKYLGSLDNFVALQKSLRDEAQTAALAHAVQVERLGWLAVSAVLVMSLFMAVRLSRSITGPLAQAVQAAQAIASGDLRVRLQSDRSDELGRLTLAMAQMSERLRSLVADVRRGVESVGAASTQIATGNDDLSGRTEQMASSLQQTASSMEELTATVAQSAVTARQANEMATAAAQSAEFGGEAVAAVVSSMERISEGSRRIADIIGTIDAIAFQTNILALNAAVEAARAGEQGRGFAVVAGEVRGLAQRSAEAAKEIKALITASVDAVASGSAQVEQAGARMHDIVNSVRRVSDLMSEIATAAGEQHDGIAQINDTVGSLDRVTQQNAALVEESTAAVASLRTQAQRLEGTVSVFKLDGR